LNNSDKFLLLQQDNKNQKPYIAENFIKANKIEFYDDKNGWNKKMSRMWKYTSHL